MKRNLHHVSKGVQPEVDLVLEGEAITCLHRQRALQHFISFISFLSAGSQSFFSRKDSIRTIYASLHNELRKVMTSGRHGQPGSASYLEDLLSHLSEQLCHFAQARTEMADLYEKMHSLAGQKSVNSEELVGTLEAVLHKYSSKWVSLFT